MANMYMPSTEGQAGAMFTDTTGTALVAPAGTVFVAITFLTTSKFDSSGGLIAEDSDKFPNTEAAASGGGGTGGQTIDVNNQWQTGITIYGRWTEIDLAQGRCIAYLGA